MDRGPETGQEMHILMVIQSFLRRQIGRGKQIRNGVVTLRCAAIICFVALVSVSPAVYGAQVKQETPAPEAVKETGYPVTLGNRVLFHIRATVK